MAMAVSDVGRVCRVVDTVALGVADNAVVDVFYAVVVVGAVMVTRVSGAPGCSKLAGGISVKDAAVDVDAVFIRAVGRPCRLRLLKCQIHERHSRSFFVVVGKYEFGALEFILHISVSAPPAGMAIALIQ